QDVFPDSTADFQVVVDSTDFWSKYYTVVDSSEYSDLKLLKRIKPISKTFLKHQNITKLGKFNHEFQNLMEQGLDSNEIFDAYEFHLNFGIVSPKSPRAIIICALEKESEKTKSIFRLEASSGRIKTKVLVSKVDFQSEKLIVYMHNKFQKDYEILGGTIEVYGLK
ncbi:MAG: hypothetical protein MRY83_11570, partial [Flavobacteriales bacterium]|nr:hypothetical protein [Flavobacteriales bacterium]